MNIEYQGKLNEHYHMYTRIIVTAIDLFRAKLHYFAVLWCFWIHKNFNKWLTDSAHNLCPCIILPDNLSVKYIFMFTFKYSLAIICSYKQSNRQKMRPEFNNLTVNTAKWHTQLLDKSQVSERKIWSIFVINTSPSVYNLDRGLEEHINLKHGYTL